MIAAAAAIVPFSFGIPATANASTDHGGLQAIGIFKPSVIPTGFASAAEYANSTGLLLDQRGHILFVLDQRPTTDIVPYHLSSMRPVTHRVLTLDGAISATATDPKRSGFTAAVSSGGSAQATTSIEHVAVVHGAARVTARLPLGGLQSLGPGQVVKGLIPVPDSNLVFALSTAAGAAASSTTLSLVDVAGGSTGGAGVKWSQALPQCQLPMSPNGGSGARGPDAPLGFVGSRHLVAVGCSAQGDFSTADAKIPVPVGVGLVHLAGTGTSLTYNSFSLAPLPANPTANPMGIWIPGLDRMAVQTTSNLVGAAWYVYDALHGAWVGSVPTGHLPTSQVGVDSLHGRLYLLNNGNGQGLITADLGPTPVDQGTVFPRFRLGSSGPDAGANSAIAHIPVDTATGRLFLSYGSQRGGYLVVQDRTPYYVEPPSPNVDANTLDIAEQPGVTGANYSGSAQGYGSVIRQVGGEANLQYNVVPGGVGNPVQKNQRELQAAYLGKLELQTSSAAASVIAAAPDNDTAGAAPWPYKSAQCSDFGSGTKPVSSDGGDATCDAAKGVARASVVGGASTATVPGQPEPDVFSVSGSSLTTSATIEGAKGIVTETSSVARGISLLGGVVRIGQVAATARAQAHGRTGTASGSFERTIGAVVINGQTLCQSPCNVDTVAEAINSNPAFVGRLQVSFPQPEPVGKRGSTGGYQALVRRDIYSQTDDQTFNNQPATRVEIPGMVIEVLEDNGVPSRTVLYLAGVEAEAHYGIYRLGAPGAPPPGSGAPGSQGTTSGGASGSPLPPAGGPLAGPSAQRPQLAGPSGIAGLLQHGWHVIAAGLVGALKNFGVWAVLLAPVYLSARRWLMLCRHQTRVG